MPKFELVEQPSRLRRAIARFDDAEVVAVDTEFTRRRTFYSILELVQLASADRELCIDGRLCDDLDAIGELFSNEQICFVFHSASQDLDVLYRRMPLPRHIFDTQIAAELCGFEAVSFQSLVELFVGIKLPKGTKTSNWSKRPLSCTQLNYAMNDVRYLLPVYDALFKQLDSLGRLDWLYEECRRLAEKTIASHTSSVEDAWMTFTSGWLLAPADQKVAQKLAVWREKRARSRDMPRQWVLTDQQIVQIAQNPPRNSHQLLSLLNLSDRRVSGWVHEVVRIANEPRIGSCEALWSKPKTASPREKALQKRIMSVIEHVAKVHDMPASLVCTRAEVQRLASGRRDVRLASGWRLEIAGESVDCLLSEWGQAPLSAGSSDGDGKLAD